MAQLQVDEILDGMLDGLAALMDKGGLDFGQAVQAFLTAATGPTRQVRVGEDEDGQMVVTVDEAEPPEDMDLPEDVEDGLRELGLPTRLIQATAGADNAADYSALKAKLKGRH